MYFGIRFISSINFETTIDLDRYIPVTLVSIMIISAIIAAIALSSMLVVYVVESASEDNWNIFSGEWSGHEVMTFPKLIYILASNIWLMAYSIQYGF